METPDLLFALTVVGSLPGHCPLEAEGEREEGGSRQEMESGKMEQVRAKWQEEQK